MVESGSEDERAPMIKITFKSNVVTETIDIEDNATIEKVKQIISASINQPIEKLCLIFSGKILKDHETLKTHNIKNGMALHLVIRQNTQSGAAPARPAAASNSSNAGSSTAPSSGAAPGARPATSAGGGFGGLGANAEAARQFLNMPFAQELFNNPEIFRQMIAGNEHIQSLARQNPEIGHMLNDPDMIRQTLDMIRNPNMFNEMMRNHDQAIRNLQGIPGGEAALQRLYTDIQEPLLNSTAGGGGNPFAANNGNPANTTSRSERAGVENAEALPNPWGGGGNTASTNTPAASNNSNAPAAPGAGANMDALTRSIQQMMGNTEGGADAFRNLLTPELMQSMLSPEMIQQARTLLGNEVPGLQNISNQQLSNQLSSMLNNPDLATAMTNPRIIEAVSNIRRNMLIIQNEAPAVYNTMFGGRDFNFDGLNSGANASAASRPQVPTATDAAAGTGTPANSNPLNNANLQALLQQFMNSRNGASTNASADNRPPEERFQSQLEQLVNMGFTNAEANLRAIQDAHGDVNAAIDRLLNR